MQKIYTDLAYCYFQLEDYKEAFLNQQLAHEVYDTLMQSKVANLESEALFKYESGKKDKAIAEQSTIVNQKNRLQWLGASLIGFLLLFMGTLIYYYRRNQDITRVLRVKNQEVVAPIWLLFQPGKTLEYFDRCFPFEYSHQLGY